MKKESLFVAIAVTSFVFSAFLLISGSMAAAATPLSNQNGTVLSIQNGPDGRPTWKVSGTWNLINQSSKSPTFNASFDMMKLDGSSMHKHTVTATTMTSADFKVTGKTSTRTYYGTAIISMKEGPVSNAPIVIKLLSDGSMSIMPDPIKTKGHFGNTPIQGKTNMSSQLLLCQKNIYAIKISQSSSQIEIANILHGSAGTVNNDISYLREQAKYNIRKYIDEKLPYEYEWCVIGLK